MSGLRRALWGAAFVVGVTLGVESRAFACSGDSDCPTDSPICDSTSHTCRACNSSLDCSVLLNIPICVLSGPLTGQCVACVSAGQCTGGTPDCDVTIGLCVACLLDVECGGPTSGSVCDDGVCEPGCRGSGGNMCPSGEACALDAGAIGQCVGGDGGASGDGGGADAGRSGDGGEVDGSSGAEAGASTDGGAGDGGTSSEGGIAGDGGGAGDGGLAAGDGGSDSDGATGDDDGGEGPGGPDGSFADASGNGSGDNGGFIDGAGCSCAVRGGPADDLAGAMFGVAALLGTVRGRRGRARGRRLK